MYERIALIWFSCFCCASENFSLMPAAFADDWIDFVFAARQPLSEPTCEKPSVMLAAAALVVFGLLDAPTARTDRAKIAAPAIARAKRFFDT